jgi:hypothetical protein
MNGSGFVRAVALAEHSLLGADLSVGDRSVAVIDEARRNGTKVILLSDRSVADLRRHNAGLLGHFDGVVTGRSRRETLLRVLNRLDVDPHDALGVSGDAGDAAVLDALEVSVVVTDPGPDALDRVLHEILQGQPAVSPACHDVQVQVDRPEGGATVDLPGAHANVLICAAGSTAAATPAVLVRQWSAAGYQVVVLDLVGDLADERSAATRGRAKVMRVDAEAYPWRHDVRAALHIGRRPLIVDLSGPPTAGRSATITRVLSAVRDHRARTGRPHWLLIDGAERLLHDPDIPPEALDLAERGHCLVLRDHGDVSAGIAAGADVAVPCGPGCPVPSRSAPSRSVPPRPIVSSTRE